jgi:gas vesicle protein GvpN
MTPVGRIQSQFGIVGRESELALSLAVLQAGHHLLLEGPVGVGKTTVALAVCGHLGRSIYRVDGDDRYTENKLTGWFDPPVVLKAGYGPDTFTPGPLIRAMREGAILFINELNRMPEAVQNVLLPTLDERRLIVPHVGEVTAAPGFLVVATQNPVEYVATGHLSEALRDRFEHVGLHYQDELSEIEIVRNATSCKDAGLVREAVRLTRETRCHPKFKKGASIRAAMAMVRIALLLTGPDALKLAARAALATRVDLKDENGEGLDSILDTVLEDLKKKTT